jgi:hypothetical protein
MFQQSSSIACHSTRKYFGCPRSLERFAILSFRDDQMRRPPRVRSTPLPSRAIPVAFPCPQAHEYGIGAQISPSSGPPGTEFLDAETGRQKQSAKRANARRDQNPGNERSEIPAETPYLAWYRKRAVCGDWMVEVVGHKLKTHHPVIEPVSDIRVGNGIFRCRDGGSRSAFLSCRD